MELAAEVIGSLLDRWPVARLATRCPDGRPHLVPIVFARVGEVVWSPVDGKPKRGEGGELARVRNLESHPAAALLLDDYTEDWRLLWWLRIDAVAQVVRARTPDAPQIAAAVQALRAKYSQYADTPVTGATPTLLKFETRAMRSWCASEGLVP